MEWWQALHTFLAHLEWWQLALLNIASILAGAGLAMLVFRLIIPYFSKQRIPFARSLSGRRLKHTSSSQWSSQYSRLYANTGLHKEKAEVRAEVTAAEEAEVTAEKEAEVTAVAKTEITAGEKAEEEPVVEIYIAELLENPELQTELEYNRQTATNYPGGDPVPLQSDVWDSQRYSAFKLPSNLREQLEQVYDEIHQLNSIVWLSTELSHRTSLSDEIYRQLLTSIAERLNSIKQNME